MTTPREKESYLDRAALEIRGLAEASPDPVAHLSEKLAAVILLTDIIREDVQVGLYSSPGSINVQSVHELVLCPHETLEGIKPRLREMEEACSLARSYRETKESLS